MTGVCCRVAECTQLEDPRLEWRAIQEAMLRDYLHTAQDVLEVCTFSFSYRAFAGSSGGGARRAVEVDTGGTQRVS